MARHAVHAQHLAHLLQHVAVVVHARLVDAQGDPDTAFQHGTDRSPATLQTQVGAAVVADARVALGDQIEIVRRRPDPVSEGHALVQQAHAVEVDERRAAGTLACVCTLIGRLQQVQVDGRTTLVRQRGYLFQCAVRTPLEVQRGELDRHVAGFGEFAAQDSKHFEVVVGRERLGADGLPQPPGEVAGQTRVERLVVGVDDPVLIAQAVGVRHAHPDIPVGPDDLSRPGRDLVDAARHAVVEVLDGGDAGTHELERGVERIEMDVDPARPQSVVGPELQGQVRRAEL